MGIKGIAATKYAAQLMQEHVPTITALLPLLCEVYGERRFIMKRHHKRASIPVLQNAACIYVCGDPLAATGSQIIIRGKLLLDSFEFAAGSWDNDSTPYYLPVEICLGNLNSLVHWYLVLSYLYYTLGHTVLPDAYYDYICGVLYANMNAVSTCVHGSYVDVQALTANTGFHLGERVPQVVKLSAMEIMRGEVVIEC